MTFREAIKRPRPTRGAHDVGDRGTAENRRQPTEDEAETPEPVPKRRSRPCPPGARTRSAFTSRNREGNQLLTARQEVEIGRRIEVGQIAPAQTAGRHPHGAACSLDFGDRPPSRADARTNVIVLPRRRWSWTLARSSASCAFARIRRLERRDRPAPPVAPRQAPLGHGSGRIREWIAANREAIQRSSPTCAQAGADR